MRGPTAPLYRLIGNVAPSESGLLGAAPRADARSDRPVASFAREEVAPTAVFPAQRRTPASSSPAAVRPRRRAPGER